MINSNDNNQNIIDEAVQLFIEAQMQGKESDLEEYVKKYTGYEQEIKDKIKKIQKIEGLFSSLMQADDSDFVDSLQGHDLIDKKIGSFEIEKIISYGGMGVVYLAHDTKLKRSVAIKSIPAKLSGNSVARKRFRREAELLASLNHPNIAVIHEIIEEEKNAYLVLEYIEGHTLAEYISDKPIKLAEALTICRQIAEAISTAHRKGIVHRDLKPGNIKITTDGQVKVLDFGLAKPLTSDAGNTEATTTQRQHIMGTPAYMSPEQARGKSADHRTDIWSFGCIMYQMLTGHIPFEGETATDTLAHIIEREPDWKLLPREIPENIRILLGRCLEKNPDKRLADMKDIIQQISDTLSKSLTTPVLAISSKFKKTAMIIGAVFIVTLAAVGVWFAVQPPSRNICLVVLPFENLGSPEYFAPGITNEITTRLGSIHGFDVIANQSAIEFKKMGIANAIDSYTFDYFIEGAVQCEIPSDPNSQVKISIKLIDVTDSTVVWQLPDKNRYMSDIFAIQSEIAEEVARALDIILLVPERKALAYGYTDNTEAYACFLEGQNLPIDTKEGIEGAIKMYEKAMELEPNYAEAHASLSNALTQMYWFHGKNPEFLENARKYAEKAIVLEPGLPGAHVSLGRYYFQGCLDYENALEQFEIALKSHPNHVWATAWTAYAKRRQGKFEESLDYFLRAIELNPRNTSFLTEIAGTHIFLRNYEKAEEYCNLAISRDPNYNLSYYQKCSLYKTWKDDTSEVRNVIEEWLRINKGLKDNMEMFYRLFWADLYDRDYENLLTKLDQISENIDTNARFIPMSLLKAEVNGYLGKDYEKLKFYQKAKDILEDKVNEYPDDDRYHSSLGKAYAGLGPEYKEKAITQGRLAVQCSEKDALQNTLRQEDLARIYVMVGEDKEAINILEQLLISYSHLSRPKLRNDPVWDTLRDNPRFKQLVEE